MTWDEEKIFRVFLQWLEKHSCGDEENIHTYTFTTRDCLNLKSAITEDNG